MVSRGSSVIKRRQERVNQIEAGREINGGWEEPHQGQALCEHKGGIAGMSERVMNWFGAAAARGAGRSVRQEGAAAGDALRADALRGQGEVHAVDREEPGRVHRAAAPSAQRLARFDGFGRAIFLYELLLLWLWLGGCTQW